MCVITMRNLAEGSHIIHVASSLLECIRSAVELPEHREPVYELLSLLGTLVSGRRSDHRGSTVHLPTELFQIV